MKLIVLLVRLLVGGLFIGHGTQKLFGWFGGYGPEGTGGYMESLGMKPGRQHALAAGATEAGGGALLALGLATPAAGAAITGVMATAIRTVHQPNGPWVTENGWEHPATVIAAVLAVVEAGPGSLSLDAALGSERKGTGWALAALIAGAGGSALLLKDWERPAQAEATEDSQPSEEPAAPATQEPATVS
ncbi:MAG TPA: DoxX family protein [Solirubrobacteraceae bacterium]|jgi:putative oxidoreductase